MIVPPPSLSLTVTSFKGIQKTLSLPCLTSIAKGVKSKTLSVPCVSHVGSAGFGGGTAEGVPAHPPPPGLTPDIAPPPPFLSHCSGLISPLSPMAALLPPLPQAYALIPQ